MNSTHSVSKWERWQETAVIEGRQRLRARLAFMAEHGVDFDDPSTWLAPEDFDGCRECQEVQP